MAQNLICPEHEELAAFAEGLAGEDLRRRVLQHLDHCDHCREIVVEAHLFLRDGTLETSHPERSRTQVTMPSGQPDPNADPTAGEEKDSNLSPSTRPVRKGLWPWGLLAAAVLLVSFLLLFFRLSQRDPSERLMRVSAPSQSPYQTRAEAVFQRLIAVIDKPTAKVPRLELRRLDGSPFAMALEGERVLLSDRAMEFCYEGVPVENGDARLAFVLAHELEHLQQHEFGHAFLALSTGRNREKRLRGFREREGDAKVLEKRADEYAMVVAAMADFQPRTLLEGDRSFFEEWAAELPAAAAFEDHPEPSERAALLLQNMRAVAADIRFFEHGLEEYRAGNFRAARKSWTTFAERFPSREVSNNLGLTWYQEAAQTLAHCNGSLVMRLRLPLQLAETTLAERVLIRGSNPEDPCYSEDQFRDALKKAREYFQEASRKDPAFVEASVNQVCSYLLQGNPEQALALMDDIQEKGRSHPALDQLEALTRLLVYRSLGSAGREAETKAFADLEALQQKNLENPDLAYNLGSLFWSGQEFEKARTYWTQYLDLVPEGAYADYVRDRLGLK